MLDSMGLLIGILYKNTENELAGCQNDVIKFQDVMVKNYGYKPEKITMLIDKDGFSI